MPFRRSVASLVSFCERWFFLPSWSTPPKKYQTQTHRDAAAFLFFLNLGFFTASTAKSAQRNLPIRRNDAAIVLFANFGFFLSPVWPNKLEWSTPPKKQRGRSCLDATSFVFFSQMLVSLSASWVNPSGVKSECDSAKTPPRLISSTSSFFWGKAKELPVLPKQTYAH